MTDKPINQYAVSQVLGSTAQRVEGTRFGGFGLVRSAAEVLLASPEHPHVAKPTDDECRLMVQAFEGMRDGYAPGRMLWDKTFARAFIEHCRQAGLALPEDSLKRQLINIRKSATRFARKGIKLSRTTKKDPRRAPRDEYVHAIEFGLVRLKYRYGASIDDILLSTELGREFERSARSLVPNASAEELRLGALFLRKTRNFKEVSGLLSEELDSRVLEAEMVDAGRLSALEPEGIPEGHGLLRITEGTKYLFVCEYSNLRASLMPFVEGSALAAMADAFWAPDRDELLVSTYLGDEFRGFRIGKWEICLIHERRPLFNWPVRPRAA